MSSSQPPAGGPAGRLPGDSLGDPLAPPVEVNGSSSDRGDSVDAPERNLDAEDANQNRAQQVRAQAVERAQQIRGRAAEKAPQMAQENRGKAMGALAFLLLVLWLRRRRNRRASRTGDGVSVALDQQARSVVDTVNALSAEAASTGRAQDKTRKVRGRAAARTLKPASRRRPNLATPDAIGRARFKYNPQARAHQPSAPVAQLDRAPAF